MRSLRHLTGAAARFRTPIACDTRCNCGESILRDFHSAAAAQTDSNFVKGVVQTYECLLECHKYMVGLFLQDPDGYAKPGQPR